MRICANQHTFPTTHPPSLPLSYFPSSEKGFARSDRSISRVRGSGGVDRLFFSYSPRRAPESHIRLSGDDRAVRGCLDSSWTIYSYSSYFTSWWGEEWEIHRDLLCISFLRRDGISENRHRTYSLDSYHTGIVFSFFIFHFSWFERGEMGGWYSNFLFRESTQNTSHLTRSTWSFLSRSRYTPDVPREMISVSRAFFRARYHHDLGWLCMLRELSRGGNWVLHRVKDLPHFGRGVFSFFVFRFLLWIPDTLGSQYQSYTRFIIHTFLFIIPYLMHYRVSVSLYSGRSVRGMRGGYFWDTFQDYERRWGSRREEERVLETLGVFLRWYDL